MNELVTSFCCWLITSFDANPFCTRSVQNCNASIDWGESSLLIEPPACHSQGRNWNVLCSEAWAQKPIPNTRFAGSVNFSAAARTSDQVFGGLSGSSPFARNKSAL